MKIELEVMRDTPLAIADAIIEWEIQRSLVCCEDENPIARENIRQIGQALINHAWSCERLDEVR